MKNLILKSVLYIGLILLALEGLVRVLHLYTEDPPRFIDEKLVEKRVPGHQGYAVTGNRNQNFSEFRINSFGFNSANEFNPSKEDFEIALIGDSFIEGFHQDYDDSTGEKIENLLQGVSVYEYGYAGYDLANQMHLINAYAQQFALIDKIVIYLNFESDLGRAEYQPNYGRINMLNSMVFKIRDNIKLLAYGSKIGILEPLKRLVQGGEVNKNENEQPVPRENSDNNEDHIRLTNFKSLINLYGFDKTKTSILFDSRKTSNEFIEFCNSEGIDLIDFSNAFQRSKKPTTLIYDHHWNNNGRTLIASQIAEHFKNSIN
ncbi:hypothetical protein JQC67_11425 [Aurantibacter crassamenti]|uniref:hypothetical protein n=1 Tax=Aurantibacter crassamenti TaxID=1837375 RepID=UPI0019396787|nr:hypothetical protein [Aurantibacter crassamenti]MBM1106751.1 hypothetical protein [Aurantibacter crassamenti]